MSGAVGHAAPMSEPVGWGGLHVEPGRRRHVADLGVGVATAHQGKGIGTALITALLDVADNWLGTPARAEPPLRRDRVERVCAVRVAHRPVE